MSRRRLLQLLIAVMAMAGLLIQPGTLWAQAGNASKEVPVLIAFRNAPQASEEALVHSHSGRIKYTYELVPAIAASLPEQAIAALEANPSVVAVEPDLDVYAVSYDTELNSVWGVKRIGAGTVQANGSVGTGMNVAIIDTGMDYTHPELAANYKGGYDFVNSDDYPLDDNGHGTHVAGTIGAIKNGLNIVGVAPGANLYALKVLNQSGSGKFSDVIAALEWCVKNDIDVTNNSYGSTGDPGSTVQQAFNNAYAAGILSIAAAGNNGTSAGTQDNVNYPARYASVVAVAASDSSDHRASWSCTGPDVELIAPGVSIYSTVPGGYAYYSGTSMATPHVVGAAALVWAANPNWSNEQVRFALTSTAQDLGLPEIQQGYGLVRPDLAISGTVPPPSPSITMHIGDLTGTRKAVNSRKWQATVTVTIHDQNQNPVAGAVVAGTWSVNKTASATTGTNGTCSMSISNLTGTSVTFKVTNVSKTGCTYSGTSETGSLSITINRP